MIRPNLLVRRIATSIAPKHLAPASSAASSSSAVDSLTKASPLFAVTPSPLITHTLSSYAINNATSRAFSSASRDLNSILQREIEEEDEAAAEYGGEIPPELAELHSDISENWTILEGISGIGGTSGPTGSGASVRLFRKKAGTNGAKIGIVFHCQDTEDDDFGFEEEFESQDEEAEPAQAVRFGVTVSKGGKTVVLQCRAGQGEVNVESVAVRDGDTEAVLTALAAGEGVHSSLYQVRVAKAGIFCHTCFSIINLLRLTILTLLDNAYKKYKKGTGIRRTCRRSSGILQQLRRKGVWS